MKSFLCNSFRIPDEYSFCQNVKKMMAGSLPDLKHRVQLPHLSVPRLVKRQDSTLINLNLQVNKLNIRTNVKENVRALI